ncbi:hypothetical protein ACFOLD_04435 [Kocuria carniphila]|uniref:hypothetical protein n=1 Tax=Kocuria carniphila TaxID=262208 RepID=UPI00360E75C8
MKTSTDLVNGTARRRTQRDRRVGAGESTRPNREAGPSGVGVENEPKKLVACPMVCR